MEKLLLTRIANYLMMNASFQDDLGVYRGKMGCVLFFAHYSRYTNQLYYGEFASELLDEICESINDYTPVDFAYGICGIAWGIEHLVQQNFTQGDTGDILQDLNTKIMEWDPSRIQNLSFEKGLKGIAYYIRVHTQSPYAITKTISIDYLTKLNRTLLKSGLEPMSVPVNGLNFPETMSQKIVNMNVNVNDKAELSTYPLGVVGGLAGLGLKMIGL